MAKAKYQSIYDLSKEWNTSNPVAAPITASAAQAAYAPQIKTGSYTAKRLYGEAPVAETTEADTTGTTGETGTNAESGLAVADYNPYSQYLKASNEAADNTYNTAIANADLYTQQSIADAQNAYRNARSTYGANAERYLSRGLTGSGISEYADASAYATMRSEIANANAANAYAKQTALYNRDQAYASADAYMAQVEQSVYENMLNSVLSGGLTEDNIDSVASAYGLNNSQALEKLRSTARTVEEQQRAQINAQIEAYDKAYDNAYNRIITEGITDEDEAARIARNEGFSEDSDAYAKLVKVARTRAEALQKYNDAAKAAWNVENAGSWTGEFKLHIGDDVYNLKALKSDIVTNQNTINKLNKMATGDEAITPSSSKGKMTSTANKGAVQVLGENMYIYDAKNEAWIKVKDKNTNNDNNKVSTAVAAWKTAVTNAQSTFYNDLGIEEKKKLLEDNFFSDSPALDVKDGIKNLESADQTSLFESILSSVRNADDLKALENKFNSLVSPKDASTTGASTTGASTTVKTWDTAVSNWNNAVTKRKNDYIADANEAIPNQYKGTSAIQAYKDHQADLNDELLTDELKKKAKESFVKNQGMNGLGQIFENQFKTKIKFDSTGKTTNGYINNIPDILDDYGWSKDDKGSLATALQGWYNALGYPITYQQAVNLVSLNKGTFDLRTAKEYAESINNAIINKG